MQALKALVIFLGVLIIAGLALVIYGLVDRFSDPTGGPSGTGTRAGFGEATVELPVPCRIAEAHLENGRLVLRTEGPAAAGCPAVVVLDPESGREVGRVIVAPAR